MAKEYASAIYKTDLQNQHPHTCNTRCINDTHFEVVFEFYFHATEEQVKSCLKCVEILSCKRTLEFTPVACHTGDMAIGAYGIIFKWR